MPDISANDWIEMQTKAMEGEFGCSRPRPRNWAMGFERRARAKPKAKPKRVEVKDGGIVASGDGWCVRRGG
jgi:hypothetical protein